MLRELRLHRLDPDDGPALAAPFVANDVPEVTRWFDPFPLDAETATALSRHDGNDLYWGASAEAGLVGFAMVRGWDDNHPQPAYGCFVDRHAQGQRIGETITRLMLEQLRQEDVPEVRARIHDDNVASL